MKLAIRRGASDTKKEAETTLIERDGKWGFITESGHFIAVAPIFGHSQRDQGKKKKALADLLDRAPNLKQDMANGHLTLSLGADGTIYFHTTMKGYKEIFGPDQSPRLSGAALDKWAEEKAQAREMEISKQKIQSPQKQRARLPQANFSLR